ncbi:hypothetical protein [Humibacter ginsenosidimutans]|uniref:Uncharacterized protein n=1 Tax=Humibacter ginsenosidimutans TaxID=2599293 RepID=A0A5B8M2N7_9MICO|nr:hypothetical protein [Humibacter ginsenosidimutans]QDZ14204.1 hypothetical protein FPZ11_04945 [Humibacter ginsenosidimutans]
MSLTGRVQAWDLPVVEALDAIEQLPGWSDDRVEWAGFRFFGTSAYGPMEKATIYAYQSAGPDAAPVTGTGFSATDSQDHPLDTEAVARHLEAPAVGTAEAIALLGAALSASLTAYNTAHAVASRQIAQIRRAPAAFARPAGVQTPARSRFLGG